MGNKELFIFPKINIMGVIRNAFYKFIVFQIFKKLVMTKKSLENRLRHMSAAF